VAHNPGTGLSSSMSGRLQDVSIQYLGEEGLLHPVINTGLELVSSSATLHPTLNHRLSLDHGSALRDRVDSNSGDLGLVEVTVSIPPSQPKAKTKAKGTSRRTVVRPGKPRGSKSSLVGPSSKRRNPIRSRTVAARKRLCQDQPAVEAETLPDLPPPARAIPATKKNKAKVDFLRSTKSSSLVVASWNCQGLGGPLTVTRLREIHSEFSPNMLFLMETKNQDEEVVKVAQSLGFVNRFTVPPPRSKRWSRTVVAGDSGG